MKILGIHDGHLATACLLVDGKLTACASEERFTRVKYQGGIPKHALTWIFNHIAPPETIDAVAVVGLTEPLSSGEEEVRHKVFSGISSLIPRKIWNSSILKNGYIYLKGMNRQRLVNIKKVLSEFGVPVKNVYQIDHHLAHAAAAYYFSPFHKEGTSLVITLDGGGDGISGRVSIGKNNSLEEIVAVSMFDSIGTFYSMVTKYLGMKPLDEEYKVMGLAPYAPSLLREKSYQALHSIFQLSHDQLEFQNVSRRWGNSFLNKLNQKLLGIRFDGVAGGLQKLFEELVVSFVKGWMRKAEISKVCLAGGCFMNIKTNGILAIDPEVKDLFVMPSCGDESVAIGGAAYIYALIKGKDAVFEPLDSLALGPAFSFENLEEAIHTCQNQVTFEWKDNIEEAIVQNLLEGKIIGRVSGNMEWGARALGNRSILSDPRHLEYALRLNKVIKQRDFWMPFAPTLLHEFRNEYLVNPKDVQAPYMNLAFQTKPRALEDLIAGIHPADQTCRPQIVTQVSSASYYQLIKTWFHATGCGGLINTSFNLHGEPIVCSPEDALKTFLNSGLDVLFLENFFVKKR